MQSLIVRNLGLPAEERRRYSDLKVLRSAAGFYIGTLYTDESGCVEPGSRDSVEYYPTEDLAMQALTNETFTPRDTP